MKNLISFDEVVNEIVREKDDHAPIDSKKELKAMKSLTMLKEHLSDVIRLFRESGHKDPACYVAEQLRNIGLPRVEEKESKPINKEEDRTKLLIATLKKKGSERAKN